MQASTEQPDPRGQPNAPGHHATIEGPDGEEWILYHAMLRPKTTFRSLFLDRIDWVDGWPVINVSA